VDDNKNRTAVAQLELAGNFAARLIGLMGKKSLPCGAGLLITKCNSIHMFFMRFAIDAVFVDKAMRVVKIVPGLKPWRVASCSEARHTLELPAGGAAGIEIGDQLRIVEDEGGRAKDEPKKVQGPRSKVQGQDD